MFSNKFASCSIPYLNLFSYFIKSILNNYWYWNWKKGKTRILLCISHNMIHQKKKKKRKLAINDFLNQLSHLWTIQAIKNCHFLQCNHCLFIPTLHSLRTIRKWRHTNLAIFLFRHAYIPCRLKSQPLLEWRHLSTSSCQLRSVWRRSTRPSRWQWWWRWTSGPSFTWVWFSPELVSLDNSRPLFNDIRTSSGSSCQSR